MLADVYIRLSSSEGTYKTEIPPRSAIDSGRLAEHNDLYNPCYSDKGSLCYVYSHFVGLKLGNIELDHLEGSRNVSRIIFLVLVSFPVLEVLKHGTERRGEEDEGIVG